MGDLKWRRRSSKIRRRSKEVSTKIFSLVDSYVWKETDWKNADKKDMGSCNWDKEKVCAEEGKDVSVVKEGERRSVWVHTRTIKEEIY